MWQPCPRFTILDPNAAVALNNIDSSALIQCPTPPHSPFSVTSPHPSHSRAFASNSITSNGAKVSPLASSVEPRWAVLKWTW